MSARLPRRGAANRLAIEKAIELRPRVSIPAPVALSFLARIGKTIPSPVSSSARQTASNRTIARMLVGFSMDPRFIVLNLELASTAINRAGKLETVNKFL